MFGDMCVQYVSKGFFCMCSVLQELYKIHIHNHNTRSQHFILFSFIQLLACRCHTISYSISSFPIKHTRLHSTHKSLPSLTQISFPDWNLYIPRFSYRNLLFTKHIQYLSSLYLYIQWNLTITTTPGTRFSWSYYRGGLISEIHTVCMLKCTSN